MLLAYQVNESRVEVVDSLAVALEVEQLDDAHQFGEYVRELARMAAPDLALEEREQDVADGELVVLDYGAGDEFVGFAGVVYNVEVVNSGVVGESFANDVFPVL